MKKYLVILFLCVITNINVFAEEDEKNSFEQKTERNSFSLGINLSSFFLYPIVPGLSLEYERLLGKYFSAGLETGTIWLIENHYAEIRTRYYPWSGMFFAGISWGIFNFKTYMFDGKKYIMHMITTELGWKINLKKNKKWFLMPSIAARAIDPRIRDNNVWQKNELVMEMILPELNFKIGYAF